TNRILSDPTERGPVSGFFHRLRLQRLAFLILAACQQAEILSPPSFLHPIHCLVVIASAAWQSLTSGLLRGLTPRNDRICAPTGPAFRSEALEGPLIRSFALEHSPTPNAVCP